MQNQCNFNINCNVISIAIIVGFVLIPLYKCVWKIPFSWFRNKFQKKVNRATKVLPSINTHASSRVREIVRLRVRESISTIGVSAPLRRHTRNVKISISDSRGAQPVTVKRRADALNEHAASVIPDGTFWNFNEDWLPPSLRRFSIRNAFLGHRSQITSSELQNWLLQSERDILCCKCGRVKAALSIYVLTISGKIFRKKRNYICILGRIGKVTFTK